MSLQIAHQRNTDTLDSQTQRLLQPFVDEQRLRNVSDVPYPASPEYTRHFGGPFNPDVETPESYRYYRDKSKRDKAVSLGAILGSLPGAAAGYFTRPNKGGMFNSNTRLQSLANVAWVLGSMGAGAATGGLLGAAVDRASLQEANLKGIDRTTKQPFELLARG
jgi:hypothetical protein